MGQGNVARQSQMPGGRPPAVPGYESGIDGTEHFVDPRHNVDGGFTDMVTSGVTFGKLGGGGTFIVPIHLEHTDAIRF